MQDWLNKISSFFVDLVKDAFTGLVDWVHDAFLWLFEQVLNAISSIIAAIPAPDFLTNEYSLNALLSGLSPFTLYVIGNLRLPEAFAIVASGVAFRLARKAATLGQW